MNSFINLETKNTFGVGGVIAPIVDTKQAKLYPTQDLLKKYFTKYDFYAKYFGENIIMEALTRGPYSLDYFAKHEIMGEGEASYHLRRGRILADGQRHTYTKKESRGEWSREVQCVGYDVWIPKTYDFQYQMFIREMFELKYPWMIPFRPQLLLYAPNSEDDYIFLETGDKKIGAFYIQLRHLKNLDIKKLVDTHIAYQKMYYRWPGGWGKEVTEQEVLKWRKEHSSAAWQEITMKFLSYIELERLYRDNGRTDKIYY